MLCVHMETTIGCRGLRLVLSPSLKEHYTNEAFKRQFLAYEGKRMLLPHKYLPDAELLTQHRDQVETMSES